MFLQFLASFLLLSIPLFAYIPSTPAILKKVAGNYRPYRSWIITRKVSFGAAGEETGEGKETIYFKAPSLFRRETVFPSGKKEIFVKGWQGTARTGDGFQDEWMILQRFNWDFPFQDSSDAMAKEMESAGISLDATSLEKEFPSGGKSLLRIFFVIGKEGPENTRLWIHKNSFLPARLSIHDPRAKAPLTVLYEGYGEVQSIPPVFPSKITFLSGTRIIREMMVESFQTPKLLSDDIFDIHKLKKGKPFQR